MAFTISRGAQRLQALTKPKPTITQTEIAIALGVTVQTVNNWVWGRNRPDEEHWAELERLTGIPAADWQAVGEGPANDSAPPPRAA